jgi:hypothetical protein
MRSLGASDHFMLVALVSIIQAITLLALTACRYSRGETLWSTTTKTRQVANSGQAFYVDPYAIPIAVFSQVHTDIVPGEETSTRSHPWRKPHCMVGLPHDLRRRTLLRQVEHSVLLPSDCIEPNVPTLRERDHRICLHVHFGSYVGISVPVPEPLRLLVHCRVSRPVRSQSKNQASGREVL